MQYFYSLFSVIGPTSPTPDIQSLGLPGPPGLKGKFLLFKIEGHIAAKTGPGKDTL
jgi:hypothetical protein